MKTIPAGVGYLAATDRGRTEFLSNAHRLTSDLCRRIGLSAAGVVRCRFIFS